MGNCMETYPLRQEEEEAKLEEKRGGFDQTSKMRIKVVLTKEELEWLVFQLEDLGGKSLEDVVGEIESSRGKFGVTNNFRGKVFVWRPSLESIMESPEVLDMER